MVAGVELRQLRYFVAVAEAGNISRAAKRIFLTQPALSRQIKALEDELGQCLLERQAHSVRLTRAGQTLLTEARELLRQAEGLIERVRAAGREVRLRVGYAPSLAAGLLSAAVASFTQKHPQARAELFDLSTKEMLAGLNAGTLDAVLTVRRTGDLQGVTWTSLLRTSWKLAVPPGPRAGAAGAGDTGPGGAPTAAHLLAVGVPGILGGSPRLAARASPATADRR